VTIPDPLMIPHIRYGSENHAILYLRMLDVSEGITYFNRGSFREAVEVWEGLWHRLSDSPERRFLQGLIMTAAAFHHFLRCEYGGTDRLLTKGMALLEMNRDTEAGIALDAFLEKTRSFYEKFLLVMSGNAPGEDLEFPKIENSDM
jgi:hypothetical protein